MYYMKRTRSKKKQKRKQIKEQKATKQNGKIQNVTQSKTLVSKRQALENVKKFLSCFISLYICLFICLHMQYVCTQEAHLLGIYEKSCWIIVVSVTNREAEGKLGKTKTAAGGSVVSIVFKWSQSKPYLINLEIKIEPKGHVIVRPANFRLNKIQYDS